MFNNALPLLIMICPSSILSLPIEELLSIACDPSGSRVLDVILEPPSPSSPDTLSPQIPSTIPFKARKRLIMKFIESDGFITLVDDKLGSRVADRCWAAADPYLRVSLFRSRPGPTKDLYADNHHIGVLDLFRNGLQRV